MISSRRAAVAVGHCVIMNIIDRPEGKMAVHFFWIRPLGSEGAQRNY